MKPSIVVITGPTGAGKTTFAIQVARQFNGEVINADSVQLYRGFDIGSAKPSSQELNAVPHHLFSVAEATDLVSAGEFLKMAREEIAKVLARGALPVVSGGSGLYVRSLLCGLADLPATDQARKQLEQLELELKAQGLEGAALTAGLHEKLRALDPESASIIRPTDRARVRRALSVHFGSGKSIRRSQTEHANQGGEYCALVLALFPDRTSLYSLLDSRVDLMFEQGLIEEVSSLRARLPESARPFGAIGYRHVSSYLRGETDEAAMREKMKQDTRRYAKRQYTWWNNQPRVLGWDQLPPLAVEGAETAIPDGARRQIERFLSAESPLDREGIAFQRIDILKR